MTIAKPQRRHIAHFNWATLVGDLGSPEVAGFETAVPRVNALAERSPGFVWRDGNERENALAIGWPRFTEDPRCIASFSVWESPEDAARYIYKTVHGAFLRQRTRWFAEGRGGQVLWWVPAGHIPDAAEARAKVDQLAAEGPGEAVFTFAALGYGPAR
ncbi:protein of unknown function [Roseivivax lentus]|uniref:DUF3291 domain-containing protein n=1 Tax=Roseivivax lentus TaxID=633194 RepID=A0A1N7M000_9RHOB|nr:DUF3291 domain-containing protein [Roseivivax lentus]SIS79392.1 protein of unknown function [Roseivivax lentus]